MGLTPCLRRAVICCTPASRSSLEENPDGPMCAQQSRRSQNSPISGGCGGRNPTACPLDITIVHDVRPHGVAASSTFQRSVAPLGFSVDSIKASTSTMVYAASPDPSIIPIDHQQSCSDVRYSRPHPRAFPRRRLRGRADDVQGRTACKAG